MIIEWNATKKHKNECFYLDITYLINENTMEARLLVHHYNYPKGKLFYRMNKFERDEIIDSIVDGIKEETNYMFGGFLYNHNNSGVEWVLLDNKKRD